MMEKSASRNELQSQTHNGVHSEFKEDTFGENTLPINPDMGGEAGSVSKNAHQKFEN